MGLIDAWSLCFLPLKCIEPLSAVLGHGKNTFITHFTRITCRDLQKSYQGIVVMRVCSRFTGDDTSACVYVCVRVCVRACVCEREKER